ncbi:hypothetical protein [Pseudomonas prosekii]|uniref:hypothetical protein n=1 Tax=Pseudomonas prosekii TaxID=1148509 RepID=UPI002F908EEB
MKNRVTQFAVFVSTLSTMCGPAQAGAWAKLWFGAASHGCVETTLSAGTGQNPESQPGIGHGGMPKGRDDSHFHSGKNRLLKPAATPTEA